ncbi:hypothetical protein BUE76_17555 [Cnuella takakiae]|nr:hypothetical protein BUE76_17555 [Cnuella takakiae]
MLLEKKDSAHSYFLFHTTNGVKRFTICPGGSPGSNILLLLISLSLFTYMLAVQLPLRKVQHGRTGRNTLQPGVNDSLTLNFIVCRTRQLNPGRISLLKRKAQHRRKRIQRKKHGKVKMHGARFTALGFFLLMGISRNEFTVGLKCR